jgi:hypothetical protein
VTSKKNATIAGPLNAAISLKTVPIVTNIFLPKHHCIYMLGAAMKTSRHFIAVSVNYTSKVRRKDQNMLRSTI